MQSSTTSTMNLRRLIRISLATAIICIVAPISIPVPVSPVPITLTTFILLVLVYVLGWKDALASCALYLALGAFGLPVFSGFSGGLAKLTGPTGGYLLGFLLFILISGLLGEAFSYRPLPFLLGILLGSLALYVVGTLWLSHQLHMGFIPALSVGVLPYLPGAGVKILLALLVGPALKKRLPAQF